MSSVYRMPEHLSDHNVNCNCISPWYTRGDHGHLICTTYSVSLRFRHPIHPIKTWPTLEQRQEHLRNFAQIAFVCLRCNTRQTTFKWMEPSSLRQNDWRVFFWRIFVKTKFCIPFPNFITNISGRSNFV